MVTCKLKNIMNGWKFVYENALKIIPPLLCSRADLRA